MTIDSRGEGSFINRRLIISLFLKKQLMVTHATNELAEMIERTSFAGNYAIDKIIL